MNIEKSEEFDLALEVAKSRITFTKRFYPLCNTIGSLAQNINDEIITLHDIVQNNVFDDIDYYAIVGRSPLWIRDAGHSEESSISKSLFERLVKCNNIYLTNKFLYYYDLEALTNSVQNRFSIITEMLNNLFRHLSPNLKYHNTGYEKVIFSSDIEVHSILNTIIINTLSCCDILTKLAFELSNISSITYEKYPKLKSKDILYSNAKRLPDSLKIQDTLFAQTRPLVVKQLDALRNEIVHNGSLDFDYTVYYGNKDNEIYSWILFPEFDDDGNLSTYNSRRKFYPKTSETFNTRLPQMIVEFLTISLRTLNLIKNIFYCERFKSQNDISKFQDEISNWSHTYVKIMTESDQKL